jgi:hypothetical protein
LQLRRSPLARLCHFGLLSLPVAVLGVLAARLGSSALGIMAATALIVPILFAKAPNAWRPPTSGAVVLFYLIVLGVIWLNTYGNADVATFAGRGVLFIVSVILIAVHDLFRTGAEPRRRARKWCGRLQAREDWPEDLMEIRYLPEVYALQDAAAIEPGPVFDLFRDPRQEVRAAAFAAFLDRPNWRPREACAVLEAARKSQEPKVRVIAMAALGSIDDPMITSGMADFFNDPSAEVRAAAVWASLSDGGQRWPSVRDAVRGLLCDPRSTDAALPGAAGSLPVVAICDLTAWTAEPEPLGTRSVRTLIDHYSCLLQTTGDYDLITDLSNQVLDSNTATALRVELAGLLRGLGLLTPELLDRMSNSDQPGAVRLLAAEAMLAADPYHPDGLDVLRGLGRQPNREMAITIAGILQSQLGIDMGLPAESVLATSRTAGEVAKKVMAWAVARGGDRRSVTPTPGFAGKKPPKPSTPVPLSAPEGEFPTHGETLRKLSAKPGPW